MILPTPAYPLLSSCLPTDCVDRDRAFYPPPLTLFNFINPYTCCCRVCLSKLGRQWVQSLRAVCGLLSVIEVEAKRVWKRLFATDRRFSAPKTGCTRCKALFPLADTPLHSLQSPVGSYRNPLTPVVKPCRSLPTPLCTGCKTLFPLAEPPLHSMQSPIDNCRNPLTRDDKPRKSREITFFPVNRIPKP